MYLKRLESVGFKSFAERISVDFVPGVTAVVGPNGSGKSNITDAIRWVLGEQSAKSLRGSKMEDIIFQGSDSRRPLNVAEVTLVLENSDKQLPLDYEEVSVTRRVYRSGESEYSINKQSCRLKDIVDLFMDSGLGREAFSIISQGKVEEILSSKAEERRTIFEEAAGVLKYKHRKKKAEYKLAETQENLNRVEDIIYEIEQQIGPLREQADVAKKYLEKKEQLKQWEISLLITEIEQLHEEWKNLGIELDNEKKAEMKQKTAIQQREAELEKERQELQKLDEKIERLQTDLLEATEQLEKLEGKKQVFFERTKHFAENKEKLESQKQENALRLDEVKKQLKTEKKKLAAIQETRNQTKQQMEQLDKKLKVNGEYITEQIEELKSEYIELLNEQAAKRNEKQSIEQQLQQLDGKKDKQQEKFSELLTQRETLAQQKDQLEDDFSTQKNKCEKTAAAIKQLKNDLHKETNTFQEAQSKLYQGYQYIEKLKSKKEMLEDMKEDFQGFFHGVKAVLKAREESQLIGIYGAVIELIDVPKAYITAMETVLGAQSQHVVVDDDQAARNAINWLKKTNNGRATFLPLQSIQPRFVTKETLAKVENHQGFIGIAAQLVSSDPAFQKTVEHLMGHIIIAKTLKDANEIANAVMRKYRIVTLEGDVVNPGGSMSGGAQKKTNQSLFTREKDLQEALEKLENYHKKALIFEQNVEKQKQKIKQLEANLESDEQALQNEQQKLQEIQTAYKEAELRLSSLNEHLALYDQDKQQYEQDSTELQTRDENLTTVLADIANQLKTVEGRINELSDQEAIYKGNQEQLQQDYQQYQIAYAEQEERLRSQRQQTNSLNEQVSELQAQYETYANELSELLEMQNTEETELEIEQNIKAATDKKAALTKEIQALRNDRSRRTQQLQDQERELKEETKKHQAFTQAIQQKEVKANRLDVELENHLSRLQSEYVITFEKAKQTYDKAADVKQAKTMVSDIKQEIEHLGTVNIGAIDEYERISERYEFLSGQKADLVEAKQTLYTVITEMDDEMQKRFGNTFGQIKEEFAHVFKQLFGGGRAELKLTDPTNLLDTGVDIIAQPPGKKLQHLGLLSGGERALTAIALLFAILRVRPVPFCVLDEVEAALDEANVTRFAKYIRNYSENTQFIVITHRKGTMEQADVLYGVTMQESGVSRLVSVRLEDTNTLINT